jgi:hypothetical protein
MAFFDVFDVLDILDLFTLRSFIPTAIGVGAGFGVYYLSGETPTSAAIGVAFGLIGFCVGLFWQFSYKRE